MPLQQTMIVAWTGHRPDLFDDPGGAQATVNALARDLVEYAPGARFVVGGQRGVDTWAARAAIALSVPFRLVLPVEVPEFAGGWADDDRQALDQILACASDVRVVGGAPEWAFRERNRLLVAEADLLVAVWTGTPGGGTAETISFASANRTPLHEVLLNPSPPARLATGRGI